MSVGEERYAPLTPEEQEWLEQTGAAATRPIQFQSLSEFFAETPEDVEYLIDRLIPLHSVIDLSAPPKMGKTLGAVAMVAAIIRGEPFIELATTQAHVVYLYEEPKSSFREKLVRVGIDPGRDDAHLSLLHRSAARGRNWQAICAALRARLLETGGKLGVVDTWSKWTQLPAQQENDPGTVREIIDLLQAIADDTGATILWCRHEGKGKQDAPVIERGRGSSAIPGEADCVFSIGRPNGCGHRNRRIIEYEGRFAAIPERRIVDFVGQCYELISEGTFEETTHPEGDKAHRYIYHHLTTMRGRAMTADELAKPVDAPKIDTLRRALRAGLGQGFYLTRGSGKRGDPQRFWRVGPPEEGEGEEMAD